MTPDWAAKPIDVPYAKFGDPQSLNLYGYVENEPVNRMDPDGHGELSDLISGFFRGYTASATMGTVGAPQDSDSSASRAGQTLGTAAETLQGIDTVETGGGLMGGGLLAEVPSGTTSTAAVVAGASVMTVGAGMTAGGLANLGRIFGAPIESRRAGDFKQSTREEAIDKNAQKNGGTNKCEMCDRKLVRTRNQAGKTPPENQLHVHHDPPIKQGGGENSTPRVVCRGCHQKKIKHN